MNQLFNKIKIKIFHFQNLQLSDNLLNKDKIMNIKFNYKIKNKFKNKVI